ncbi:MAG: PorT family protein [Prevotella sp.]|jgi:opacity protein-like surface antigen|nr:PorT family protein [Prevotella sp.]
MRNIYKCFLLAFLLSQSFCLSAQEAPVQFGLKAGVDLYSTSLNVSGTLDKKVKFGYQLGLTADFMLTEDQFYLQTGAEYITKGAVLKKEEAVTGGGMHEWSQTFNMEYIQVPLMLAFKMDVSSDLKIYFHAGPYVAFGIGGKTTLQDKYKGLDRETEKSKQDTFGENKFKKLDYGFRFGSGIEFDKFIIGLDFEYAFANINQDNNELGTILNGKKYRNKGINLSLGYKF